MRPSASLSPERLVANTGAFILDTCFAIFEERSLQGGGIMFVQTVDDGLTGSTHKVCRF